MRRSRKWHREAGSALPFTPAVSTALSTNEPHILCPWSHEKIVGKRIHVSHKPAVKALVPLPPKISNAGRAEGQGGNESGGGEQNKSPSVPFPPLPPVVVVHALSHVLGGAHAVQQRPQTHGAPQDEELQPQKLGGGGNGED